MIQIFRTEDGVVHQKDERLPGSWIALTNPTATEILEISDAYQIDPDHLRAPLDEEERSRITIPWCWWISRRSKSETEKTGM